MQEQFGEWYRAVVVDPTDDLLTKRWIGIEAYSKDCRLADSLDLIRTFRGLRVQSAEFTDTFRRAFKDADAAFRMRDNDAEMMVLAGTAAVEFISAREPDHAAAMALAVICSRFGRPQTDPRLRDIDDRCDQFLWQRSLDVRQSALGPATSLTESLRSMIDGLDAAFQGNDIKAAGEAVKPALTEIAAKMDTITRSLERVEQLQRESSDVLWWLFGGHSRDLESAFEHLEPNGVSIICAKELADITLLIPGFFSARAFLHQAVRIARNDQSDSVSLSQAVNATPRLWREKWIDAELARQLSGLAPCLGAIAMSLTTDAPEDWVPAFNRESERDCTEPCTHLELAAQLYNERILARAINTWEA